MSLQDPYHAVQHEIETSLATAAQLRASFLRIRNMAKDDSEELSWARSELKATLAALEADLEDLEESVKIVESRDARTFGLTDAEVQTRRKYVTDVRREIESMTTELSSNSNTLSQAQRHPLASGSSTPTQQHHPRTGAMSPYQDRYPDDDQAEWAREEQQMMMREQDQTIDTIAGTLNTITQQASLMGQEIAEHNMMLDDLEQGVDRTQDKVDDGMQRLRKFLRDSEEKGSGWCILILIVVLCALLLAVILV